MDDGHRAAVGGPLPAEAIARLFTTARSANAWQDAPLPRDVPERLYDPLRLGPTTANCSPARFVFVSTPEASARLRPALSNGNLAKTMAAPLTVIVAHDPDFHDRLPMLFPHADARSQFAGSPTLAEETPIRNGTLQGAYLILAARALGLDCGPISGFDRAAARASFMADAGWEPDFLVNIGYADHSATRARLPRFAFSDACLIV